MKLNYQFTRIELGYKILKSSSGVARWVKQNKRFLSLKPGKFAKDGEQPTPHHAMIIYSRIKFEFSLKFFQFLLKLSYKLSKFSIKFSKFVQTFQNFSQNTVFNLISIQYT